jgi:hypothetical protein
MNRRNPQLRDLDRQMNRALKDARGAAQVFAVKAEFADKRRRLLSSGQLPEPIQNPPVEPVRAWEQVRVNSPMFVEWSVPTPLPDFTFSARVEQEMRNALQDFTFRYTMTAPIESEERKAAKLRAEEFLLTHLNPTQVLTYREYHYFIVVNKASGRKWKIRTNTTTFNVDAIDKDGSVIATFCGVPSGSWIPPCDIYLAQKILLETDEAEFLIRANRKGAGALYGGALGQYFVAMS